MELEDLSERLLTRSQEAILQLELWIQRQQHLRELEDSSIDKLGNQYNVYIAQLKSLCVRSEYVRDKLNKERERRMSIINDRKYIEDLVFEFQDITVKLNELAQSQSIDSTPSSKSTRSSLGSFQPRPLKLTERHGPNVKALRESPLKNKSVIKSVKFSGLHDSKEEAVSKCLSLPGSPVRVTGPTRSIRMAKSYDTGLNSKNTKKSKGSRDYDVPSIFRENQRLSITVFDDFDEDADSTSDQDTVISLVPADDGKGLPLRRFNSHESILSTKVQPISSLPLFSSFLLPSSNRPSMKSVRVSSAPVFSKTSAPASSRDLLSTFVTRPGKASNATGIKQENKLGFFANWNFFKGPSSASHDIRATKQKASASRPESNSADCRSKTLEKMAPRRFSPRSPVKAPVFDSLISYEDLREALSTEIILTSNR